jgi:cysteine-rich repeat protein
MFYRVAEAGPSGEITAPFGPISLEDQFGLRRWNVIRPTHLGLPADKNGEGIGDDRTHLTEFKITSVDGLGDFEPRRHVRILNQCNDLFVRVGRPKGLLVPSHKALGEPAPPLLAENRDHYLCYAAKVEKKRADGSPAPEFRAGTQVEVVDQFQSRRYDLKSITRLCNPVRKSGVPFFLAGPDRGRPAPITPADVKDPGGHLVCYRAEPADRFIVQEGCGPRVPRLSGRIEPPQPPHEPVENLHISNQFGEQELRSRWEVELCIPSLKDPECGDGIVHDRLGEECDDGNTTSEDGCSSSCVVEFCGDGIAQEGLGEECDGDDDGACAAGCQSDCRCAVDPCDAAIPIPSEGGIFFGETSGVNRHGGTCSAPTGPEEVYSWTPSRGGIATIDTCTSTFDTVLYIRQAVCEAPPAQIACNDDACAPGSRVTPFVEAGTTYFIFVDGFSGSSGLFLLNVSPPAIYGSPTEAFLTDVPSIVD